MSRFAKKPIQIPQGVEVVLTKDTLTVRGKGGALVVPLLPYVHGEVKGGSLIFSATDDHAQARANWGTMKALAENAVRGVSEGFSKTLEIEGIGYKATIEGKDLILSVGLTHPVRFTPSEGITITVEKALITIRGIDKSLVGETAARIRKIKKPEPYKGKGIRYQGEIIRRKAGKKVAGATGSGT